jgi:hypothetical protein
MPNIPLQIILCTHMYIFIPCYLLPLGCMQPTFIYMLTTAMPSHGQVYMVAGCLPTCRNLAVLCIVYTMFQVAWEPAGCHCLPSTCCQTYGRYRTTTLPYVLNYCLLFLPVDYGATYLYWDLAIALYTAAVTFLLTVPFIACADSCAPAPLVTFAYCIRSAWFGYNVGSEFFTCVASLYRCVGPGWYCACRALVFWACLPTRPTPLLSYMGWAVPLPAVLQVGVPACIASAGR